MPSIIEKEINASFSKGLSLKEVSKRLVQLATNDSISNESLTDIGLFLLRAGELESLLELTKTSLLKNKPFSVSPLYIAYMQTPEIREKVPLNAFLQAAIFYNQQAELAQANIGNQEDLHKLTQEKINKLKLEFENKRNLLLEKIEFFKNENLLDQEKLAIKTLELEYPNTTQLPQLLEDFKNRFAFHLVQKGQSKELYEPIAMGPTFTKEETEFLTNLTEEILKLCQQDISYAIDFAILFYFMGALNEALKVLSLAPDSLSKNWLQLEWLIEGRRFVEAVEKSNVLQKKFPSDPETQFACVYTRARALWGLNKFSPAIELMQSLVKIRPQYRSAESLLAKWNGGSL